MNKKALIGILAIAVAALFVMTVVADTWVDVIVPIGFTADPAAQGSSGVSIGLYTDCWLTTPVTPAYTNPSFPMIWIARVGSLPAVAHNFGMVSEGNTYEWPIYVVNNGSKQVYITYLPTTFISDDGQTAGSISITVIAYGLGCETSGTTLVPPLASNALPYNLPEKFAATPQIGFLLMPNKVIKLDVKLTINSIMADQTYEMLLDIAGVSVTIQM
jgi:hypothetical protein